MVDYQTDSAWNLDLARKNATRTVGYLARVEDVPDLEEATRTARNLEEIIQGMIDELGDISRDSDGDSGDTASRGE